MKSFFFFIKKSNMVWQVYYRTYVAGIVNNYTTCFNNSIFQRQKRERERERERKEEWLERIERERWKRGKETER